MDSEMDYAQLHRRPSPAEPADEKEESDSSESIDTLYENLQEDLRQLTQALQQTYPVYASVSRIPPTLKGEESLVTDITPEKKDDSAAVALALEAFNDLKIMAEYSQKCVRRYVGMIQLDPTVPETDTILRLIRSINATKASIKGKVTELDSQYARFKALHDSCPGLFTLHLYRQIHIFIAGGDQPPVQALRFSWLQKDNISRVDKKELVDAIKKAQSKSSSKGKTLALSQLKKRVESASEEKLRERRDVKVQPVANISGITENGEPRTVVGSLPIIVVQAQKITTNPIPNFKLATERKERSDKLKAQFLGSFGGKSIFLLL